jgi:hypothetical protein
MTLFGRLELKRFSLRPASKDDAKKLAALNQGNRVFPLDEALGIDKLPFKISLEAMLEICHWVVTTSSYDSAGQAIKRNTDIVVDEETIRSVVNHCGYLVFKEDKLAVEHAWTQLQSGNIRFPAINKDFVLNIEVDGAMVHVRKQNGDNFLENNDKKSVWMENKLGMVFSSEYFLEGKDKDGDVVYKIGPREYIPFLGEVDEFKKHLFATALRNGYGSYKQTILLSDGATWIRNMKEELFPDAQQILDFYHLYENVSEFAKEIFVLDEKNMFHGQKMYVIFLNLVKQNKQLKKYKTLMRLNLLKISKN